MRMLVLTMISLHTKFEVPRFTHSEAMKKDPKCKHRDGLSWLESLKITGSVTVQCST